MVKKGHLGERNLKTVHVIAQSLAIGPIFSMALIMGIVSTGAGYNTVLSILITALGVFAIGYVITYYARRYSGAGSVYEYISQAWNPGLGTFFALVFFLGLLFLGGGGLYLGLGDLIHDFWASYISSSAIPPWWLCGFAALVIELFLHYRGVKLATNFMLILAVISATPMVILAFVIIAHGGHGGVSNTPIALFNPGWSGLGKVFSGILISILLFVGFEEAAALGEEALFPQQSIPRAVMGSIFATTLFYGLMAYAMSIGYGQQAVNSGAWASAGPTAVTAMAKQYIGGRFVPIIQIVVILDSLALGLAFIVGVSRGFFALGRDGLMPDFFARTSRYDTPLAGNFVVFFASLAFMLLAAFSNYIHIFVGPHGNPIFPTNEFATFVVLSTVGSFAIELAYLALAIVAIRLIARNKGSWWQYAVTIVAAATPILAFYGALTPGPHNGTNVNWAAFYYTLGIVAVSFVWVIILKALKPQHLSNAASHAAVPVATTTD